MPLKATEISIVADPYMPYTGDPESDRPGFMIEIIKAICERAKHTISYKKMPWDTALMMAKNGDVDAIVGANKEDVPEFIFPEVEQAQVQGIFYGVANSSWKYTSIESLDKVILGVINNYNYTDIQDYIKKNRSNSSKIRMFSDEDALEKMANALAEGKIQTFLEDRNVMQEFLKSYPKSNRLKEVGQLPNPTKLYIAFSPKRMGSQDYAKIITEGMTAIRADGTLKKILDKYSVQDW